jgi:hypothetical protein
MNYEALNVAELQEEAERLDQAVGGNNKEFIKNFVKMPEKEGYVIGRVLPPTKGKKLFCRTRTHKVNERNFHCPRELVNGKWVDTNLKDPCPHCKWYNELYRMSDNADTEEEAKAYEEEAKKIKPIERYYYNFIVKDSKPDTEQSPENGPLILSVGKTLHQKIVRAIVGDPVQGEPPLGDISDPKLGRDFKIVKRIKPGKDKFPSYDDSKFAEVSVLADKEQVDKWLENLHDLQALRILRPTEEMSIALKKHNGVITDEKTSFNADEYRKPTATMAEEIQREVEVKKPVVEVPSAPASKPATPKPDKVLVEDDFLEELRNM